MNAVFARAILAASLALLSSAADAQVTTRVSVASNGIPGSSFSGVAALSGDGRLVAFSSQATDLVAGDTNGKSDIFVHDRQLGTTTRVSTSSLGVEADADCLGPFLSADGRFVSFRSAATTLVPNDTNDEADVFVHDLVTGNTERVSIGTLGNEADGESYDASLSNDGRFVAFVSDATNLAPASGPPPVFEAYDVYVRDRLQGTTERVSVAPNGEQGDDFSVTSSISGDGRFVAFVSAASNLVAGDTSNTIDVFVRDLQSGTTELVNLSSQGSPARGLATLPSLSADGRFVVFESSASELVPGDSNGVDDIFVRDRTLGTTKRISLGAGGEANGASTVYYSHPSISGDGRYVVFESDASNLVAGDGNGTRDVFLADVQTGAIERLSVGVGGEATSICMRATISASGNAVAFETSSRNLVAGDANKAFDVFVRDLGTACPPIEAYCSAKLNSQGCLPSITSSGIPSVSTTDAFYVAATDVLPGATGVLVWGLASASVPFAGGTLCIGTPLVRTPRQTALDLGSTSGCAAGFSFHFSHAYFAAHGLTAGTTIAAQYVYGDAGFAAPNDVGMTGGLRFTTCP